MVIDLKWVNWTWELDDFKMYRAEADKADFPNSWFQILLLIFQSFRAALLMDSQIKFHISSDFHCITDGYFDSKCRDYAVLHKQNGDILLSHMCD